MEGYIPGLGARDVDEAGGGNVYPLPLELLEVEGVLDMLSLGAATVRRIVPPDHTCFEPGRV